MKVLTAKRAVLYQGRMYEPGDTLPAGDSRMVEAWLQAESAEWTGEAEEPATEAPESTKDATEAPEGTKDATEAPEGNQGTTEAPEGTKDATEAPEGNQGTTEAPEGNQGTTEDQEGNQGTTEDQEGTLDVVGGHLTRESLETMTKTNLEKLAKDMGVEIPRGATKALIIDRLAAAPVEVPAPDGGAQ